VATAEERAKARRARSAFERTRRAEIEYGRKLRRIADNIATLIEGFDLEDPRSQALIDTALRKYAETLKPWAAAVGKTMIEETARRDFAAWAEFSQHMGQEIRAELRQAPTGLRVQQLLDEQVGLITSLPIEAAERVQHQAAEGLAKGERAKEIADRIMETGHVTRSRANLIARTETGRVATTLTQARAESVGSEGYIWRTSKDSDVRPSHKAMEGKRVLWSSPPTLDGLTGHAGALPNCFPASTKVSLTNGCHNLLRRWYEGDLVIIEHEGGFLDLTPNHPILCRRGWVAAQDIEAGDDIVQSLVDHRLAFEDDENQGQPTFGDLFRSLDVLVGRERQSRFLFNLHGERPGHDVDAIRSDHLLAAHVPPFALQGIRDLALSWSNSRMMKRCVVGGFLHVPESRGPGLFDQDLPGLSRHGLHAPDVRLGGGSTLDAVAVEYLRDGSSSAAEFNRNGQLAVAALIGLHDLWFAKVFSSAARRNAVGNYDPTGAEALAERVRAESDLIGGIPNGPSGRYKSLRTINKIVRKFAGHVFTMETANGWFTVGNSAVVVKNCRCYPEPILPND